MIAPGRRLLLAALCAMPLLAVAAPAATASAAEVAADQVTLFRAAQIDDHRSVAEVLARGLDPNMREPERGETALIVAMRYDAMQVFERLLAHPAIDLDAAATNGNTALMMAAFRKNQPAVIALLDKGAQVNREGWTPLHYAAAAGDVHIMRILLARGAKLDTGSPTGLTPLMLAAREGMEKAVKLLLEEGADATLKDRAYQYDAAGFADHADKPWISQSIRTHLQNR